MSWPGQPLQVNMHGMCSRWQAEGLQVKAPTEGMCARLPYANLQVGVQKCSEGGTTGGQQRTKLAP